MDRYISNDIPAVSIASAYSGQVPASVEQASIHAFDDVEGKFSSYRKIDLDRKGSIHGIRPLAIAAFRIDDAAYGVDLFLRTADIAKVQQLEKARKTETLWIYRDSRELGRFFVVCRDADRCLLRVLASSEPGRDLLVERFLDAQLAKRPLYQLRRDP